MGEYFGKVQYMLIKLCLSYAEIVLKCKNDKNSNTQQLLSRYYT